MVLDVMRALARRWYVVLIGLVLTAGMVYGAYKVSPPEYTARALVLLLPSRAEVGRNGNPFLHLDGLEPPAGILAAYFSSAPARADVERLSPTAKYEVGIDDSTRGPVIAVDVTDESAAETLRTLDYLLARIPEEFTRLQKEVDARGSAVVGSMPLTVDREPEADLRGTIRAMIAALVVGLVATGVSGFAFDGFAERRNLSSLRRRQALLAQLQQPLSPDADPTPHTPGAGTAMAPVGSDSDQPVQPQAEGERKPVPPASPESPEVEPEERDRDAEGKTLAVVPTSWSWGGTDN